MKHSLSLTAAALFLTGCAVFALMFGLGEAESSALDGEAAAEAGFSEGAAGAAAPAGESENKMFLREFDGKLALFVGEGRYPKKVYDLFVRSLPLEDRTRLSAGIEVSSEEELKSLLEDFTS
ncbi:MAG: BofC C-terminal domain-containing protein [Oscillospiraceae bacterium]